MALQGTIDTFPLTDVLHLLSTSARSGRLVLDGDRGTATLWLEGGHVIGGGPRVAAGSPAPSLVLEMLRFRDGSFVFDNAPEDDRPEVSVDATPLEECLTSATALHEQWAAIEAVVPSGAHVVRLGTPSSFPLTVSEGDWKLIAAASDRSSVDALGQRLGLDEYEAASAVAELVGRGLLVVEQPAPVAAAPVIEPTPAAAAFAAPAPAAAPSETARPSSPLLEHAAQRANGLRDDEVAPAPAEFPDRFPIDDLLGVEEGDAVDPWISNGVDLTAESSSGDLGSPFGDTAPAAYDRGQTTDSAWDELIDDALDADEPDTATSTEPADSTDEVLRQMSRLSPQAAEAIAAALNTGPGGAAHDVEDGTDGPSFLGSR